MHDFAAEVLAVRGTCLFFVGQAGFIIKSAGGQLLAIDLYLTNCLERFEGHSGFKRILPRILHPSEIEFDAVICTHPHLDHFDIDAVPEMVSCGARLFCSVDCERLVHRLIMDYYNDRITYVRPGDRHIIGDFDVSFVNCDHGSGAPDAVGAVVRVDGKTIYEVGDSRLRLDRVNEAPQSPDVLISPINGMFGNMDSDDTAALAEALRPSVTIPCHYGMTASHGGDLKRFHDLMDEKGLPALIMRQGERYRL